MADATAQATETQKKNAELKEKSVEAAYSHMGTPTPTQTECDLAALGAPLEEHADDGSGPSPEFRLVNVAETGDVKTRQSEAHKPGSGNYQTRSTTAAPKRHRSQQAAKLTMANNLIARILRPLLKAAGGEGPPRSVPTPGDRRLVACRVAVELVAGRHHSVLWQRRWLGDGRGLSVGLCANRGDVPR